MMMEWLSDYDRLVPLGIVVEADEISYGEGGGKATHDSPTMRVYIVGW